METVKQIIDRAGYESAAEMDLGDRIEVSAPGMMDLTIEKIRQDKLSVAHYWKQRGDLMRDPEIVFEIGDDSWLPIEYRQDPSFHQMDSEGLEISDFIQRWDDNLEAQGSLDNMTEAVADE